MDKLYQYPDNSENSAKGRVFQDIARQALKSYFGITFIKEFPVELGSPAKVHSFDLASTDKDIIVECKNYGWTVSGKIPHGKLRTLDQAMWYFSFLQNRKCVLVMRKDVHPSRSETLAEYYYRSHGHLFRDTLFLELDIDRLSIVHVNA